MCRDRYRSTAVGYRWARLNYTVKWANPLWDMLEMDPTSELDQINARIAASLSSLPTLSPPQFPLDEVDLATNALPILFWARLRRDSRAIQYFGTYMFSWVWTPPWEWR